MQEFKGDLDRARRIHDEFIRDLDALRGTLWKEVICEMHSQYSELPCWILFFEDTDLDRAHAAFAGTTKPYFEKLKGFEFTVLYQVYRDGNLVTLDFLTNNQEITRGWSLNPPLGSDPDFSRKKSLMFRSTDSKR